MTSKVILEIVRRSEPSDKPWAVEVVFADGKRWPLAYSEEKPEVRDAVPPPESRNAIASVVGGPRKERAHETPAPLPAQADVLGWAVRSFGLIAKNADERAARIAEEAMEIAQVEGVPLVTLKRIADRVYSRPPGERWQEIGGTMIGILSYAENVGLSVADCANREFQRVLSKPKDWWTKKHAEKVAAGTADLSQIQASESEGNSRG